MIILPEKSVKYLSSCTICNKLYFTDIGYFPNARNHFRKRHAGSMQNILIYCQKGSGWISIAGKKKKLESGQYCIIPKKTPHSYAANSLDPWSIYWIHFNGDHTESLFPLFSSGGLWGFLSDLQSDKIVSVFNEIFYHLDKDYSKENLEYTSIIFRYLISIFSYKPDMKQLHEQEKDPVNKAIAYMKENISRRIELKELASHSHLSVSQLSLLFRKRIACSPIEHLNNLRIQKACQMLDMTDHKVKDIAEALGYSDPLYFSRSFSRSLGISPRQYRNNRSG